MGALPDFRLRVDVGFAIDVQTRANSLGSLLYPVPVVFVFCILAVVSNRTDDRIQNSRLLINL